MTPKALGFAGIAGIASAVVTLSVISGGRLGIVLVYATPLPMVLIGLSFGFGPAALASSLAAAVVASAAMPAVPAYLVIGALPALLLTWLASSRSGGKDGQEWRDPGEMLVVLALVAVLVMSFAAFTLPTAGKPITEWLRDQAVPLFDRSLPGTSSELRATIIGLWISVMPALVGGLWLFLTMINGLFGQWAASQAGLALRPTPNYGDLRLPLWLALAAGLAGMGGLMDGDAGYVSRNAGLVLAVPFMLAGMVDIHRELRARPQGVLWLAVFYGAFFALFGWVAMPVTAWGVVRQWMRSRRVVPAPDQENSDGSHSA